MTPAESRALMAREIAAQAATLQAAIPALVRDAPRVGRDGEVWVAGCGDGLFAAETMARVGRAAGFRVRPLSSAALLWDAQPRRGDACVALSISGGTARTVEALAAARAAGAWTLAVTVNTDSALSAAADATLALPYAPITRATPHSLDHTMTLLALAALFGVGADRLSAAAASLGRPGGAARAAALPGLAAPQARFFFIGCGAALGSAGYGAAKLHEAGGIAAMALEGENLAHGAQFMFRPGDHAVLLGDGGPGDRRTADLRGGLARLGLTVSDAGFGADPLRAAFDTALWCQQLCLAVAEARDLDVTRPGGDGPAAAVQRDWFAWR